MSTLSDPGHKIGRQFKVLNHFAEHGWAYPVSAEIDLTWRCALNCAGCHSKWLHANQELKPGEIERILRKLTIKGLKSVVWSGGGDPMESPYWKHAMDEASKWKLSQGLYSYVPEPTQEKVDYLDNVLEFAYTHNFRTKGLRRVKDSKNVWTAGWLVDASTWQRIEEYIEKTDLQFFNYVDFRPLIVPGADDYGWVPDAIEALKKAESAQVTWARYKFEDLLEPIPGERHYKTCYSTDFTASIGPNGDMYQCLNRRGVTVIGNLLTESLEEIWARKAHTWTDFDGCRLLCRNHEMNKTLDYLLGAEPRHASFI